VISLISDVIDDPLDVIASGPSVPDSSSFRIHIPLKKYDLLNDVPANIVDHMKGVNGKLTETPKSNDQIFTESKYDHWK
jgi:hydroxypyruvate reductase